METILEMVETLYVYDRDQNTKDLITNYNYLNEGGCVTEEIEKVNVMYLFYLTFEECPCAREHLMYSLECTSHELKKHHILTAYEELIKLI